MAESKLFDDAAGDNAAIHPKSLGKTSRASPNAVECLLFDIIVTSKGGRRRLPEEHPVFTLFAAISSVPFHSGTCGDAFDSPW